MKLKMVVSIFYDAITLKKKIVIHWNKMTHSFFI